VGHSQPRKIRLGDADLPVPSLRVWSPIPVEVCYHQNSLPYAKFCRQLRPSFRSRVGRRGHRTSNYRAGSA
jgi:hypothetical protein